ncbi:hypothetical protein B566_EDAN011615 [Ephemera danica]|nr:hypothetical protein B566_EDAN011615 [Ephemera danica]
MQDCVGGCCGSTKKSTIVGGWAWAWWLVTDVQRLSLEVMTLNPMCEHVETAQGVPLTVTGVAQCKIMKADELLQTASEQFLGKTVKEVKMTVLQTLEDIGVAQANRDAGIREADCEKSAMDVKYNTDTKIEDNSRMYKLQKANFDKEEADCEKSAMDVKYNTDTKIEDNSRMYKLQKANFDKEKAEAQLAYELQAAKIRQRIRNEEIQIEVVERRKQIEVEQQEVQRKERELSSTVRLPAEAESYRVQMIAEGKRTQTVAVAQAEAEKIKKLGAAEAYAIEAVGKAEAERMRMKAAVYKQYGDAAIMSLVLDALPKIAAEVSAPLAKTEEIVLLSGDDRGTAEIARLAGQIPPAIQALTGVDLSKVLSKLPGAK